MCGCGKKHVAGKPAKPKQNVRVHMDLYMLQGQFGGWPHFDEQDVRWAHMVDLTMSPDRRILTAKLVDRHGNMLAHTTRPA